MVLLGANIVPIRWISFKCGVFQGDFLNPMLFCIQWWKIPKAAYNGIIHFSALDNSAPMSQTWPSWISSPNKCLSLSFLTLPRQTCLGKRRWGSQNIWTFCPSIRSCVQGYKVKLLVLIVKLLDGLKTSFGREIETIPACRSSAASLIWRIQKAVLLRLFRTLPALDLA